MTLLGAFRAEGEARGYEVSEVALVRTKEPRVEIRKGEGRTYAFSVADYFEDLPDDLAADLAESVFDAALGYGGAVSAGIRRHVRAKHLDRYLERNGLLRPELVGSHDIEGDTRALKDAGRIPEDFTVVWAEGDVSLVSPSFRLIGIPLCLSQYPEEIPGEIEVNARILKVKIAGARL